MRFSHFRCSCYGTRRVAQTAATGTNLTHTGLKSLAISRTLAHAPLLSSVNTALDTALRVSNTPRPVRATAS